jgi:hypothetical protein
MGWNGNVSTGIAGTTSALFKTDVLRRINFYRALVGLPADVTFNSTKSSACQDNALWISANGYLTHSPSGGKFYKSSVLEAASKSNLYRGRYGPSAVDGYMEDNGVSSLGHRRWIIYSLASEMGTGDVPENSAGQAANSLWVIGNAKTSSVKKFLAWPNAGYAPINFLPSTWSLSYPGANFSGANITMTERSSGISVQCEKWTSDGYGDNALIWTPATVPSNISSDTCYDIQISGIGGTGVPSSYSYSVTLFDPKVLGDAVSIIGDPSPPSTGSTYTFNQIEQADQYQLCVYSSSSTPWTEGAESTPTPNINIVITGSYDVIQSAVKRSGSQAFHLAFPGTNKDQLFEISRNFIPSETSQLRFYDLGRYATTTNTLEAEVSATNGLTWESVWSRAGVGLSPAYWDASFKLRTVGLSAYAGKVIRVRFKLKSNNGYFVNGTASEHGFFVDDISVTNSTELKNPSLTILQKQTTQFSFSNTTAGGALVVGSPYYMRIRPMVGTQWFDFGAATMVTPTQPIPPTITTQPVSATVKAGDAASLYVIAEGSSPISYQWKKDGVAISGGTNATLAFSTVNTSESGSYSVTVTNGTGSATSSVATLSVVSPPSIISQPSTAAININSAFTFSVTAVGTGPLSYQWKKGTVNIPGATSETYTISSAIPADAGIYSLTISNAFGSVTSNSIGLFVYTPVSLTTQPAALTLNPGSPATFTVVATGTVPMTYQWRKDGISIAGATSSAYSIPSVQAANSGAYSVTVTNPAGSVTSHTADLAVNTPVSITKQPAAQTLLTGSSATLNVVASGTAPITYQWRKGGINIDGATSPTYSIPLLTSIDAGSYSVIVANPVGSVTSNTVHLKVNAPVSITTQPDPLTLNPGSPATFTVVATGTVPMTYQWRKDGISIAGATSSTYSIPSVQAANSGAYSVVIKNSFSSVTSQTADLALNTPVSITAQPNALTLNAGSNASFDVIVKGTEPITYQWRKGGIKINGATHATYSIASSKISDAGSYSVVVSNPAGSVISESAYLAISKLAPAILSWPNSSTLIRGQSLSESALEHGFADVPGTFAFSAPGLIPNVGTAPQRVTFTPSDLGRYSVVSTDIDVSVDVESNPPVITSPKSAAGIINKPFAYKIRGTNNPASFNVTGLPAGLSLNSSSGLIFGEPVAEGKYPVSLRATNSNGSGDLILILTISSHGGSTNSVNWTDITGTYAGLLKRTSYSESEDEAVYRGAYQISFSRTGAFSGRIFYNESRELRNAIPNRIYSPINVSFSGVLAETKDNPLVFQKIIRLGTATSRGNQELTVEVSFLTGPPTVNIEVRDYASPRTGESEWTSHSSGSTKMIAKLTEADTAGMQSIDYSEAAGHYTLLSAGSARVEGNPDDAYFLVQVLPTGKLVWTGRMHGVSVSGGSGLQKTGQGLRAPFYGGWTNFSATLLKTTSVLGVLNFEPDTDSGFWSGHFGSNELPGKLEKQASQVFKSGNKLMPRIDGRNRSGITKIDFSNREGVRWRKSNAPSILESFSVTAANPVTFILSAHDPVSSPSENVIFTWRVSIATNGRLSVTSLPNQQGLPSPSLILSLERMRGGVFGSYVSEISGENVRRNIYGCVSASPVLDSLFARGWVEANGFPEFSTAGWTLHLGK